MKTIERKRIVSVLLKAYDENKVAVCDKVNGEISVEPIRDFVHRKLGTGKQKESSNVPDKDFPTILADENDVVFQKKL